MRIALVAALVLVASSASAAVTQPNGLVVPQAAPPGEQNLSVFFSARGEALD